MKGALLLLVALVSCSAVAEGTFGLLEKWGKWKNLWGYNTTSKLYQPDRQPCPAPSCNCPYNAGVQIGGTEVKPYVELTVSSPEQEAASCCAECKATPKCRFWQVKREHDGASNCLSSKCYLFADCGIGEGYGKGYCYVLSNYMWIDNEKNSFYSGALCETEVKHDPHFLGAHGTKYDFNGLPGKVFALITDERLAVNMLLHGYVDTHFLKKATLTADGKGAIRTWIRELGIVWKGDDGIKHTLRVVARSGLEAGLKRGPGFMELMEIDGVPVTAVAKPGDEFISSSAGVKVAMQPYQTQGPVKGVYYDLDNYDFIIDGLMTFQISFRAAEPEMMMKDEAGNVVDNEVHISFTIHDLKHTPSIHGVLGQTYREDHAERAQIFKAKVKQLKERIQADGETGKGFLDGEMLDYQVDSLFSTAWKFSSFKDTDIAVGSQEGEVA